MNEQELQSMMTGQDISFVEPPEFTEFVNSLGKEVQSKPVSKQDLEELKLRIKHSASFLVAESFVSGLQSMCPKITEDACRKLLEQHRSKLSIMISNFANEVMMKIVEEYNNG